VTGCLQWRRVSDGRGDGYARGNARVWDNGNGFGSSRGSGRWAVEVAGQWVANVDLLADAKTRAVASPGFDPAAHASR
jgi:hypothetical protein